MLSFNEFIKENLSIDENRELKISFSLIKDTFYDVDYTLTENDITYSFSGIANMVYDEKGYFEPNYFEDDASEEYYNDNQDIVDEDILKEFGNIV